MTPTLKIGFKTAQFDVDWPTLLSTWQVADELPVFDSGWLFDHFVGLGHGVTGGSLEGWTLAAALSAHTKRLTIGHLVLGNTYREPALLAQMAATLDHVAQGRFILGLGAGWHAGEHEMFGWQLPPPRERIEMLRSAVSVIRALWSQPRGVSLDAPPYRLVAATCEPPPLTKGGPPIWLGTQGSRGLRIAAEMANGWNDNGRGLEAFQAKRDTLLRQCSDIARDSNEIEISVQLFLDGDDYGTLVDEASRFVREGARHIILAMPANQGPDGIRRLAERAANPLREKFG